MTHVQRKLLNEALNNLEQYEVKKTRATLEIKKENGILKISYKKEPLIFEGEYDTQKKILSKESGNITNRHMLTIMESELVFEGNNRSDLNNRKPQFRRGPKIK